MIKDDAVTSLSTVESTVELDLKSGANATCIASLGGLYKKTSAIQIHPEALVTTDPSAVAVAVGRKSQQPMGNFAGLHPLHSNCIINSGIIAVPAHLL